MEIPSKNYELNRLSRVYVVFYLALWLTLASVVLCSWNNRNFNYSRAGGVKIGERDRSGSGVKIGAFDRSYRTNQTGRVGAGIQIGGKGTLKSKEITPDKEGSYVPTRDPNLKLEVKVFKLRLLLPYKSFGFREYNKAASSALNSLKRGSIRKLDLFKQYDIETQIETLTMTPSPTTRYLGKWHEVSGGWGPVLRPQCI